MPVFAGLALPRCRWAVGMPTETTSLLNGGEVKVTAVPGGSLGGVPGQGLGAPPGRVLPVCWKLENSVNEQVACCGAWGTAAQAPLGGRGGATMVALPATGAAPRAA